MSERTRVPDVRVLLLTTGPRANVRSKFFPFSNEILLTGAGRRKFKGKAEGWWRLARFFLIVGSQTSLASFAVPSATRELWRWKGSRQIGPPMSTPTSWAQFAKNRSLDESDLLCQRRNHLQVFSTSCCPHLARISLTFAFTWLRFT